MPAINSISAITSAADAPGAITTKYCHAPEYDPGSGVRLSSGERLLKPTNVSGSKPVHVNRINTGSNRVKMTRGKSAGVGSLAVNTDVSISEIDCSIVPIHPGFVRFRRVRRCMPATMRLRCAQVVRRLARL